MAARKPMCTLPRKTCRAMRPPIIAAAMLSRKLESTNTSDEQDEAALPVVGQEARQDRRRAAVLEMLGEEREADQQPEEVGERHPFVADMRREPGKAGTLLEVGEEELVERDHARPATATLSVWWWKSAMPEQGQREKDEVEGDARESHGFSSAGGSGVAAFRRSAGSGRAAACVRPERSKTTSST